MVTLPRYVVNDANNDWACIHIDDNLEKTCLSWIIKDACDKMVLYDDCEPLRG